ncbi:MAG: ectoine hydrolase DoeA [Rhodospirillales bacterium]|nr:ectoine hydrolase DoeA [Rhodospirillales bacterium]
MTGSDVTLNFSRQEYAARIAKTRTAMNEAGIELLIATDPSNMGWLTGYDGWSFYTHQCVLVPLSGEPIWFGRGIDAAGARRTTFLDDDHIIAYADHYVQSTERHPMDYLSEVLTARGLGNLHIGVEMDNYYFSAACYASLVRHLPNARFRDATGLVNWQRAVKSAQEIIYMKRAARIVEAMHARIFEIIEPGMKKNRLAAEIFHCGISGADGHGGDYPAIVPMLPSGMDATAAHLTWDDREMKTGEATFFEIAGCHRRYHCPQSRTVYLGPVPQKYLDAEKAVLAGIDAGLEKARPGNRAEDIAEAFFTTLRSHGFEKDNRTGYSIGMSYPPDWGERTISLRRGDKTVLQPDMCIHFMPALWLDDGGLEITEPIRITETGSECLTTTPRQLMIKT